MGLVMWMPVIEPAIFEANGMVMARGSHKIHREVLENGTWTSYSSSVSGQLQVLSLYTGLGRDLETVSPSLEPGDILVFNKCLVHSSSGVNTVGRRRFAWQARYLAAPQVFPRAMYQYYPEMGTKHAGGIYPGSPEESCNWASSVSTISGIKYPLVFPQTIREEDEIRSRGHVILTHWEWFRLMLSYPKHLLATNFVRVAERLGLDLNGSTLGYIVKVSEYFGII